MDSAFYRLVSNCKVDNCYNTWVHRMKCSREGRAISEMQDSNKKIV